MPWRWVVCKQITFTFLSLPTLPAQVIHCSALRTSREMETLVAELVEKDLDLKATIVPADLGLGLELLLSSCRLTQGMLGCPHVLHQHLPGCQ